MFSFLVGLALSNKSFESYTYPEDSVHELTYSAAVGYLVAGIALSVFGMFLLAYVCCKVCHRKKAKIIQPNTYGINGAPMEINGPQPIYTGQVQPQYIQQPPMVYVYPQQNVQYQQPIMVPIYQTQPLNQQPVVPVYPVQAQYMQNFPQNQVIYK